MLHRVTAAAVVLVLGATGATAGTAAAESPRDGRLSATIRYTEHGIPHILADDYESLAFGTGYAAARDTVCQIADGVVTTRGERSRYFGADGRPDGSLSGATTNRASDLFFQGAQERVAELSRRPVPLGFDPMVREGTRGYVAGYNKFLRTGKITDPACKDAPWVQPITELDMFLRYWAFAVVGGQGMAVDGIVAAAPPSAGATPPSAGATPPAVGAASPTVGEQADAARRLLSPPVADRASNAIAIGRDGTANHRGLLLGNPHYPWHGGLRFWQMQQTIPGRINVMGAALIGSASASVGYTSTMAWTITEATGVPFTLHELTLAPGDPTAYLVDGKPEPMTREAGRWNTRWGPVVTYIGDLSLPWTTTTAYALGDPNADNTRMPNAFAQIKQGRTVDDVRRALASTQGLPQVNFIAADQRGDVLYSQQQVVPHVTDELAARCNTALGRATWPVAGLAVLDGSRSECAWGSDPDAVEPGILGPSRMPNLSRHDYVANFNDSYWLTNPEQPMTGYPRILGAENAEQSLRTRAGLAAVRRQLRQGPFTPAALQRLLMANHSHAAEAAGPALTTWCRAGDLAAACAALRRWDRRFDTGSKGALLFDRFWQKIAYTERLWSVPFDPADPLGTPRGLDTANPALPGALRAATAELAAAGLPADAPLGDGQYVVRGGERIPIGGGSGFVGVLNEVDGQWDPAAGYSEVLSGSSYLQVVGFGDGDCPDARTLLTYSQSPDPESPYHRDQTELFSAERWVRSRFCERDILSAPGLQVVHVSDRRP